MDLISKGTGRNSAAFYDSNTFLEPALAKKYHREDIQSISKPSPPGSVILVAAHNLQETSQSLKPPSTTLLQHTNRANELSPPLFVTGQFSDPPMGHTPPSRPSNRLNLANKTTCPPSPSPNNLSQPSPPAMVLSQSSPPTKVPSQPSPPTSLPSEPSPPTSVPSQPSPPTSVPSQPSPPTSVPSEPSPPSLVPRQPSPPTTVPFPSPDGCRQPSLSLRKTQTAIVYKEEK